MNVLEITELYLRENGFDGLYSENECACRLDDLAPCGEMQQDCKAGHVIEGENEDFDFVIGEK